MPDLHLSPENIYDRSVYLSLTTFKLNLKDPTTSQRIIVGYSGGVDSRVLLELARIAFTPALNYKLIAVHINHNLSKNANLWQDHCELTCQNLKVEFKAEKILLDEVNFKKIGSIEAALRIERIKIWQRLLSSDDILLLAHHLNDQLETILLRLFRGTGLNGLTGIKAANIVQNCKIVRPLLNYPKAEILDFAVKNKLNYIQDESNLDQKFSRNFLRHEIIPQLIHRWPQGLQHIQRTIKLLSQTNDFLDTQIKHLLNNCYIYLNYAYIDNYYMFYHILSISRLLKYAKFLQVEILRKFIKQHVLNFPSYDNITRIYTEVINAQSDRQPLLKISKYVLCRYKDNLYIYPRTYFKFKPVSFSCTIGDRSVFYGKHDHMPNSAKVKKIFQQFKIPPWLRQQYPLVFLRGKLIAIVGLWFKEVLL